MRKPTNKPWVMLYKNLKTLYVRVEHFTRWKLLKISFVLGIIGGIIAILIDFAVGFFPILAYDFLINDFLESFGYYLSSNGISQIGALISEVGGILGILGVIWGTKSGGVLMIISSILA